MLKEREEEEASMARPSISLLLPLLLIVPLFCSSCCSAQGNITTDAKALLYFKNVTRGANSTFLANWNASTISTICSNPWAYVKCSHISNSERVTELQLVGISLSQDIKPNTLSQLDALRTLSLRSNQLSGVLPADFANLTSLQQLDISLNNFSGPFPDFLNSLTKLKSLDFQNNSFNGTIPSNLNLSSLEIFNVSSNKLSGPLPSNFSPSPHSSQLDLSSNSFSGAIPESLNNLTNLISLHLQNNLFNGTIPSFKSLSALQELSLQRNGLSGPLPSNFSYWPHLLQLDVSFNKFSGSIPTSLSKLTQLESLNLQDNLFSGSIPPFNISSLKVFNVSNNHLNGSIPTTLAGFNPSSFTGNLDLCGPPLQTCSSPQSAPSPSPQASQSKSNKLSKGAIVGIACGAAAAVLLLLLLLILCRRRKGGGATAEYTRWTGAATATTGKQGEERNELVFIDGKKLFDLDDLLRASAEVLGKGTLGTSYMTRLEGGLVVVTKRLHHVDESRRDEYLQRINDIASVKHNNLSPLRAYSFGKGGNLLVYDFLRSGSLWAWLHGSKGVKAKPLDWEARVKIAATSARGLAFLHAHNMVHGNLKSSNVLLMSNSEACLADYHMLPFTNSPIAYLAPEITDPHTITPHADVFSFGVLLLELLTTKVPLLPSPSAPSSSLSDADPIDLPRWVQSVARDKWTAEVFDPSLLQSGQPLNQEEMLHLLQLAMTCVAPSPDQRPSMVDVVQTIDKMCRTTDDDDTVSDLDAE